MEKSNPVLRKEIVKLEKAGRKEGARVYTQAAEELKKTDKNRVEVNLSKLQRHADEGDTLLVPGKVLGSGRLNKKVEVAAFQFSKKAREAIDEVGETIFIGDLVEKNPEGKKVKIMK